MTSVHDLTYDMLRRHGITNGLGNPGSNDRGAQTMSGENLVDERGFEPPASSLRTVGKIS